MAFKKMISFKNICPFFWIMKTIAFVDLHGDKKNYNRLKKRISKESPDFLICCGDFTIFENSIKEMMRKISKFNGKVFLVHGNHEEEKVVAKLAKQYKNIEFVHGRVVWFRNLAIVGWGGGGFTVKDVEFEDFAKKVKKDLKKYKKEDKKIILVTHAPFYGTELDKINGGHHGNKSFTKFIRSFKVDYGFCGHFHENKGKEDLIRKCKVFNPGPKGKVVEI
jgi:Icc-related predicted phosphoesterase